MNAPERGQARPGLRQTMAWLHTWSGLWLSWLLFAIFLTGTLAVFEEPIGHWMRPEHAMHEAATAAAAPPPPDRARRLAFGAAYMAAHQAGADMWEIWPADHGADNALFAYWLDAQGRYQSAQLNPLNGAVAAPADAGAGGEGRATHGGQHFVVFHYQLQGGKVGLWVVALATMVMLVALVSGVITHKRIFQDFFTFRPAKGQRSWLDAHNAAAVLSLPFHFMIAYTGLAIFALTYVPAALWAQYGAGSDATRRFETQLEAQRKAPRSGRALAVPDLEPFALRAERAMGQQARAVVLDHPGDAAMRICVYGWNEDAAARTRLGGSSGMACYAAAGGAQLDVRQPGQPGGGALLARQVIAALHMGSYGGVTVKWLYFILGATGAAMMGSGAILFMLKRRVRSGAEFGAATARAYRWIEAANVAAIAGLALACVAYLWANRLIPLGIGQRADWEVRAFFVVWALAAAHALLRAPARAWIEQLAALAALGLLLPLLNLLSTGDSLAAQFGRGDWESACVELVGVGVGLVSGRAAWRLRQRLAQPAASASASAGPAPRATPEGR